jgi:hypothetical protein
VSSKIDGNKPKREKRGREKGEKVVAWKIYVEIPLRTRWTRSRGDETEVKRKTKRKLRKA